MATKRLAFASILIGLFMALSLMPGLAFAAGENSDTLGEELQIQPQTTNGAASQANQANGDASLQANQTSGGETLQTTQTTGGETLQSTQTNGDETLQSTQTNGDATLQTTQTNGGKTSQTNQTTGGETLQSTQTNGDATLQTTQTNDGKTSQTNQTTGSEALQTTQTTGGDTTQLAPASNGEPSQSIQAGGNDALQPAQANGDEIAPATEPKPSQAIQASHMSVFTTDTSKNLNAKVIEGKGALSYAVKSGGDCVSVDSNGALTFRKAGTAIITVTAAETGTHAQTSVDVPIKIYDHFDYTFTVGNTIECVDYYGYYPINKVEIKLKNGNTVVGSATINSPKKGSSATISATGFANKIEMTAEIQQRKNTRSASEILNLNGGGRFEIEMNSRGTIVMCDYGITLPEPDFTAPVAKPNLTATGNNQLLIYPGSVLSGGQHMEYTFGTADAPNNNGWTDNYGFMRAKDPGDYYVWWKTASRDRRSLMYFSGGRLDTAPQCVKVTIGKGSINPTVSIDGWTYGEAPKTPTVSGNTGNGAVTFEYKVKDSADSTYTTTAPKDAGAYTVRAKIADSTTHFGGSATKDFTITKATLPPQNVRVVGAMGSNDAAQAWVGNFTQSLKGMVPTDAGTVNYTVGTPKYKDDSTEAPNEFQFTSGVGSDGEFNATLTIGAGATTIPDRAQEITVPVTITFDKNYEELIINVVVVPKAKTKVNVTLSAPPASVTYGNDDFTLTATVDDVGAKASDWYWYSSDPNVLEVANTGSNEMSIKVLKPGTAMILAWYEPNGGITIGAAITNPITVNKASIDARVSIEGWTYGEAAKTPSVSENPGDGTVSYEYKVKDADDSTYTTTAPKLAGEYTVRATVPETTYYKGATPTVNFTIAKKNITAYVTAPDKTYDGTTDTTVSATVKSSDLVYGDLDDAALVDEKGNVTVSGLVGSFADANVGEGKTIILNYDNVVSPVANAECYEVTIAVMPTASIKKRSIYVGADNKSSRRGEPLAELTYGVYGPNGLVEGDTLESLGVTVSTTATSNSDLGEYPITLSGGTANPNYEVTFGEDATYTIEREKPVYRPTEGNGSSWDEDDKDGLTITFKRSVNDSETFKHFAGIRVDDVDVPESEYDAVPGSVVITLHNSFLVTLAPGKHTITALFDDGDPADAVFTVEDTPEPAAKGAPADAVFTVEDTPEPAAKGAPAAAARAIGSNATLAKTGDSLPATAAAAALALAALAAAAAVYARRRQVR